MATIHKFSPKQEPAPDGTMRQVPDLVCSICGTPCQLAPACDCVGASYMRPKQAAEMAIRQYPNMSDRVIAEKFGLSHATVSRVRATVSSETVVKRTGRDGRTRRMPRRPRKKRGESEQITKAREIVRPLIEANQSVNSTELQRQHGISHDTFDRAMLFEQARKDALTDFDAAAAKHFSETGKLRIEDAIRIHKARLDKQSEQHINEEVRRRITIAADAVRENNKRLRSENDNLMRLLHQKKQFTLQEYNTILMCLHPDGERSDKKLTEAFRLFRDRKFALTGEK